MVLGDTHGIFWKLEGQALKWEEGTQTGFQEFSLKKAENAKKDRKMSQYQKDLLLIAVDSNLFKFIKRRESV